MRAACIVVLTVTLLGGCVEQDYRCRDTRDCTTGTDPRCEPAPDSRCTIRSTNTECVSGREYAPLSSNAGTCFEDNVDPPNACAEGQPPARGDEPCFVDVCERLPSCCEISWSTSCVLQAQVTSTCETPCSTRVAITIRNNQVGFEVWTAETVDGVTWSTPVQEQATSASWIAPTRGRTEPRLARILTPFPVPTSFQSMLLVDERGMPARAMSLTPDRDFDQVVSIDIGRDARDVVALGSQTRSPSIVETLDIDTELPRTQAAFGAKLSVGDFDHDPFPDAVGFQTSGAYNVLENRSGPAGRELLQGVTAMPSLATNADTGQTPGMTLDARALEWTDLDDDGVLDLLAVGAEIRAHFAAPAIAATSSPSIDCLPMQMNGDLTCKSAVSWTATSRPTREGTRVILASWPEAILFDVKLTAAGVSDVKMIANGDCANCRWVAIATRDLDDDKNLDLVLVDQDVNVYVGLARYGLVPKLAFHPSTLMVAQTNIRLSITGVP